MSAEPRVSAVLSRATFETSRALEYFSEKELTAQIGYEAEFWPVAILRELIDNALDACEAASVAPHIRVTIADDAFTVVDNGPGIPAAVIEKSLDFLLRVSTKAYYVSPTRGQMGAAFKAIWAAPFVATGASIVEITTQGRRHRVEILIERIAQQPRIEHKVSTAAVKTGTTVKIHWTDSARLLCGGSRDSYNPPPTAAELVASFAGFNPHATFALDGATCIRTLDAWDKWDPNAPTSAHWYSTETLRDLIAAYITRERAAGTPQKTVREFVAEFRGLSSTVKQKAVTDGWAGKRLHSFIRNGDVDPNFVQTLLERMQEASTPPPALALGSIGKEHMTAWMVAQGVAGQTISYQRKAGVDGLPYVFEIAFGVMASDDSARRIVAGLNWSPVIGGDPDPTIADVIAESRLDAHDPVMLLVHIARPRFQFVDRGKTRIALSNDDIREAIRAATRNVTKAWKQAKRQADKNDRVSRTRLERLREAPPRVTIRDAAFEVMEYAYNKASANGKYYANARQIMYAARPAILEQCDASEFKDVYFTQTLLKDYLEWFEPDWKVVWDARGHLIEPHTRESISLGGAAVTRYVADWHADIESGAPEIAQRILTSGPDNRFANVLFIEKEGFQEILTNAEIGARWDMAIMSTKGVPVKAACDVISAMHRRDVRIFVLHDFDYAGFKIVQTLRNGTRLAHGTPVVDLGLRIGDVQELESEPVSYSTYVNPQEYLRECGATEEECHMLVSGGDAGSWEGERVEINAMTSDQLIAWLERKFTEHGVEKLIPDNAALAKAYRRAVLLKRMQEQIDEIEEEAEDDDITVPDDLAARVKATLEKNRAKAWDAVVWSLADVES